MARGAVTLKITPTAKLLKVGSKDLCWGMVATNRLPLAASWEHLCLGGSGHETFDSDIHKASVKARTAFLKASKASPGTYMDFRDGNF